jgi:hypothetical protein
MAIPVTPATAGITAIPDPKRSPKSYQAYVAKQAADAQQASMDKSNAQIQSSYQPILDFYKKQEDATNARYAQNAANLRNIFGALTGLSAKDEANVKAQFESSITKQATDLATRTAEQRAAQAAGAAQAVATGAERGGGPAMVGSPTATATEQAIGQSNAIQTNWEGLLNAQKLNAVTDITNRGEGYSQQEVAAKNQMTQNLQDALMGIQGQQAGIQGQIAQAKIARDQAIQNNEFDQAAALQKQIDAMDLQDLKNQGSLSVAQTAAAARLAAARTSAAGGGGSSTKLPTYAKDIYGFQQKWTDRGVDSEALMGQLRQIEQSAIKGTPLFQNGVPVEGQYAPLDAKAAYNAWLVKFGTRNGVPVASVYKDAARDYFNTQY